ncbi:DUF2971 domain-containing protein [Nitrosomonas oligotropha]|uniref:DUF2971 domain-containing protein n=1 Tax=Nitrosomonas oligotropha TaxID=42354 RepID=UPI00136D5662|nr:DUF2971 domain-containing protein [Nitrosomonas oligotropha]MXS83744.1 DUF2971 domain-containing protein [Nitrosomonas oligotropha]
MLYKYLSEDRCDVLENLKIRFSQPAVLNDPFEAYPVFHTNELTISETSEEFMAEVNQKVGVLSLSRNYKNLLMWSHYASNHRGYVLGFDESHDFFQLINEENEIMSPNKITYSSMRNGMKQELKDIQKKFLLEKSIDWAYEEEIRIFKHFEYADEIKDNREYPIYLFNVPRESIKCIYIGANAQSSLKQNIFSAIRRHRLNTDVFQNKLSQIHYEIDSVLINRENQ